MIYTQIITPPEMLILSSAALLSLCGAAADLYKYLRLKGNALLLRGYYVLLVLFALYIVLCFHLLGISGLFVQLFFRTAFFLTSFFFLLSYPPKVFKEANLSKSQRAFFWACSFAVWLAAFFYSIDAFSTLYSQVRI
jgi:hypothetical protein